MTFIYTPPEPTIRNMEPYCEPTGYSLYQLRAEVERVRREIIEAVAKFVEPQRNDVPATGVEFAAAIRELLK